MEIANARKNEFFRTLNHPTMKASLMRVVLTAQLAVACYNTNGQSIFGLQSNQTSSSGMCEFVGCNLISNQSFESTNNGDGVGDIFNDIINCWTAADQTPDPVENLWGCQIPAIDGSVYIGLATYYGSSEEAIQVEMSEALIPGNEYQLSLFAYQFPTGCIWNGLYNAEALLDVYVGPDIVPELFGTAENNGLYTLAQFQVANLNWENFTITFTYNGPPNNDVFFLRNNADNLAWQGVPATYICADFVTLIDATEVIVNDFQNIDEVCGTDLVPISPYFNGLYVEVVDQPWIVELNGLFFIDPAAIEGGQTVQISVIYPTTCGAMIPITESVTKCCPLTASAEGTLASCVNFPDGTIQLTLTGAVDPSFSYSYNGETAVPFSSTLLTGLPSGAYEIFVEDEGCTATASTIVDVSSFDYTGEVIITGLGTLTEDGIPDVFNWDSETVSFGSHVIIDCDCNIQFSQTNLIFGENATLKVEEGSEVNFTNCVLTACDDYWPGIRLVGNSATSTPSAELFLWYSKIQYAQVGIETHDYNPNLGGTAPVLWSGGIVQAYNTIFNENLRSVIHQNSKSLHLFRDCEFLVSDELQSHFPGLNFNSIIYLYRSTNNKFSFCNFRNSSLLASSWTLRGMGIRAYKARFHVKGQINENNEYENEFSGFNRGISASSSIKPWLGYYVEEMHFEQNRIAIYDFNVFGASIEQNEIEVGEPTGIAQLDATTTYEGIFKNKGSNFEITENVLQNLSPDVDDLTIGIRMNNTNTNDDEIYRNTLLGFTAGNVANGDNKALFGNGGLRYSCNTHQESSYIDIAVANGTELDLMNIGVASIQGRQDPENPIYLNAANTFTDFNGNPPVPDSHFRNNGATIQYLCVSDCPLFYSDQDLAINAFTGGDNVCPTIVQIVGDDGEMNNSLLNTYRALANQFYDDYASAKYLYLSIVDGGNTTVLKEEVEEAWSTDTWAMRQSLLSKSPNVSRDVLRRMVDNTITFPHPIALEILLANPQITLDNAFMGYLSTKTDPMPQYMIDVLWEVRDPNAMNSLVVENLRITRANFEGSESKVIRALLSQDNPNWSDIESYLNRIESLNSEYLIIQSLMDAGDFSTAQSVYYNLPENVKMDDLDLYDHALFGTWIDFYQETIGNGIEFNQLNAAQINALVQLADNYPSSTAGANAAEVLNEFYGGEYFQEPDLGSATDPRSTESSLKKDPALKIFPNPAIDHITLEIGEKTILCPNFEVSVFNQEGRLVHSVVSNDSMRMFTLDIANWSSGMYKVLVKGECKFEYSTTFTKFD
jgi:hypothetical protein